MVITPKFDETTWLGSANLALQTGRILTTRRVVTAVYNNRLNFEAIGAFFSGLSALTSLASGHIRRWTGALSFEAILDLLKLPVCATYLDVKTRALYDSE